jgi:hypothetical protein
MPNKAIGCVLNPQNFAQNLGINYRNTDSAGFAGRLYDDLLEHFGTGYIFRDIATFEPGEPFPEAIEQALSTCHILIVVIGQHWLTSVDAKGQRRLDNQDDFVRMEIEGAFRRHMRVIPVLVQGARMPRTQDLPESLAPLTRLHAFELTDSHWRSDIGRLIKTLGKRPIKRRIDNRLRIGITLIMVPAVYVLLLITVPPFRLAVTDFLMELVFPRRLGIPLEKFLVTLLSCVLGLVPLFSGVVVIKSRFMR